MCTHALLLEISLCAFSYDGLDTHLLVELRMRMNDESETKFHENSDNRTNVLLLMTACRSNRLLEYIIVIQSWNVSRSLPSELALLRKIGVLVGLKSTVCCAISIL